MLSDRTSQRDDTRLDFATSLPKEATQLYVVDMLEQLMLLAQDAQLTHIASGLDQILEPHR